MSGNKLETLPCSEDGRGPQDVRKTVTGRHVTVKQVLDLVDWAHKLDAGESEVFGLDEPVDNALILDLHISHNNCQIPHPRKGQGGIDVPALSNNVNTKLSQLFNEEIFDSVLPYIVPDVQKPVEKRIRHEAAPPSKPRKPQPYSTSLTDVEVNIHVTDEYKNQRKDFKCPQSILVTKMSYFAEITSGQKLEEMDISVHCDIEVFEWIMNWVKQEPIDNCDRPVPEPSKVVAILVSAEFLQIEQLIKYCLSFIRNFINDVITATPNMSCMSEYAVCRLADMFSNTDLELITDERDKILSRLFCKFIHFLSKPTPDAAKGHYSTLAYLYKCCRCQKFIHSEIGKNIPCLPQFSCLDNTGNIQGFHEPDQSWSINKHIYKLKQELRNWRKIYWRLWGRYSCCGEKAFRFEILSKATGCQYRSHVSSHTHKYASQMNKISEKLGSEIFIDPPELKLQEKRTCFIQQNCGGSSESSNLLTHMDEFWWHGLEITPSKKPPHLLLKLNHNRDVKCQPEPKGNESPVPHSFCQRHVCSNPDLYDSSSLNEEHGDESPVHLNNNCKHQIHHKCMRSIYNSKNWTQCLSNRNNQDNQRCNEDKIVQKYKDYIIKKGFEQGDSKNIRLPDGGGLYVQVEEEWRQKNCIRGGLFGGSNGSSSRSGNVNVPARDMKGAAWPGKALQSYKGGKGRGQAGKVRNNAQINY